MQNRRMRFVLEFHGSELRDVMADGSSVRLRFAAAAVRNEAGERGWLSTVQVDLQDATLRGDTAYAFGKITDGRLRQDGRDIARVGIPGTLNGELELSLRLANGTQVVARGRTLEASVGADARFSPDLSC